MVDANGACGSIRLAGSAAQAGSGLHAQGWSQRRIAQAFGVSQAAVSHWFAAGLEGLGVGSRHGELWTCARVAAVIKEEFGVTYSRAHVSRLLKALNWTPQKPIERASQRNEAAITRWREVRWPRLKKGRSQTIGA